MINSLWEKVIITLAQSFNFCPIKDLQLINSLSLLTLEKEL